MERIKVILIDLPATVRGLTTYFFAEDGMEYYTMFINGTMNVETQRRTYDHEIEHINNGDFDSMVPIDEVEYLRHAG